MIYLILLVTFIFETKVTKCSSLHFPKDRCQWIYRFGGSSNNLRLENPFHNWSPVTSLELETDDSHSLLFQTPTWNKPSLLIGGCKD